MKEKKCSKCGLVKKLIEFSKDRRLKDGHRSSCKICDRARENSPETRQRKNAYQREKGREWYLRYRQTEKGKARDERYKQSETHKSYKQSENYKETLRRYYTSDKAHQKQAKKRATISFKQYRNEYRNRPEVIEKHRAIARINVQKRNALKKQLPNSFTDQDWQKTLEYFNHKCVYCGSSERLEQDHFIPITKNGGYTPNNIVPACKTCNLRKYNYSPEQWCSPEIYNIIQEYFQNFN